MPGSATQLVLPHGSEWRQPAKSAAQAPGELSTAGGRTTGQLPARISRFRALYTPLTEDNESKDTEQQGTPPQQAGFSILGYAQPVVAPNSPPPAPLGLPAWEGELAPLLQTQLDLASGDPLGSLTRPEGVGAGRADGSAASSRPASGAGQRRVHQDEPPQSLPAPNRQSQAAPVEPAAAEPADTTRAPFEAIEKPHGLASPSSNARRPGEDKPSAAAVSSGSADRNGRSAAPLPAPSGTPDSPEPASASAAQGQLAFTGRLAPVAPDAESPVQSSIPASPQGLGQEVDTNPRCLDASADPSEVGLATASPAGGDCGDGSDASGAGSRDRPAPGAPAIRDADSTILERVHGAAAAFGSTEANQQSGAAVPVAGGHSAAGQRIESPGKSSGQVAVARTENDPVAPQKTARDITLELDSGSQRVAVRLTERGGEVHVAVRTPDAGLAEGLRQGLPSLAAKLEQSGFRTETWHPGAAPRHPQEAYGGGAGQSREEQNGQGSSQQRREGQPEPRETAQRPQPKKEGKDFAWFMSSFG